MAQKINVVANIYMYRNAILIDGHNGCVGFRAKVRPTNRAHAPMVFGFTAVVLYSPVVLSTRLHQDQHNTYLIFYRSLVHLRWINWLSRHWHACSWCGEGVVALGQNRTC